MVLQCGEHSDLEAHKIPWEEGRQTHCKRNRAGSETMKSPKTVLPAEGHQDTSCHGIFA